MKSMSAVGFWCIGTRKCYKTIQIGGQIQDIGIALLPCCLLAYGNTVCSLQVWLEEDVELYDFAKVRPLIKKKEVKVRRSLPVCRLLWLPVELCATQQLCFVTWLLPVHQIRSIPWIEISVQLSVLYSPKNHWWEHPILSDPFDPFAAIPPQVV